MNTFVHEHRIRYHETDAQHHVFNSRYLEYIDVAMTEFVRDLGWDYVELVEAGCDPSLVHVEVDFHHPARFDQVLRIAVAVGKIGRSSWTLTFDLRVADQTVASASVIYVNYDVDKQRSRPLPERFRARLAERLEV